MKLVTTSDMRNIEADANENGLSYSQMMENAGKGLAIEIASIYPKIHPRAVLGLVGSGNNGGDTLIALRHLSMSGWIVYVYLTSQHVKNEELLLDLQKVGGEIFTSDNDPDFKILHDLIGNIGIILDGILGTGFQLPLRPDISRLLSSLNRKILEVEHAPKIVAVDCPSGVDTTTGETADDCLRADTTICLAAVKVGLIKNPAVKYVGDLKWVDIGIPKKLESWEKVGIDIVDQDFVVKHLPPRPNDAHKGTFGTTMVIAGSMNYTGAALLAGKGAYRVGSGLVVLAIPSALYPALAGHFPEATWLLLPHEVGVISVDGVDLIKKNLEKVTSILMGPGWGLEQTTSHFLSRFFQETRGKHTRKIGFVPFEPETPLDTGYSIPALVIDADAIKLLKKVEDWHLKIPKNSILTPHPGEMSILSGLSIEEIQKDRLGTAKRYAQEWGHVLVLKGANTVIASPDGEVSVVLVANAGLARAGTGDVLSGVIAGLRAQGVPPYPAACLGSWIHGQAGLSAVARFGNSATVLAGEVLDGIIDVYRSFSVA